MSMTQAAFFAAGRAIGLLEVGLNADGAIYDALVSMQGHGIVSGGTKRGEVTLIDGHFDLMKLAERVIKHLDRLAV